MSKKSRFCANCGKETDKLLNNICPKCYSELKEIKVPKRLIQRVCPKCKAIFAQGLWIRSKQSLESSLSDKLRKKLQVREAEEIKEVAVDLENSRAKIKATILGQDFNINEQLNIDILKQLCKECRELQIKKHNVKIQLRFKSFSKSLIEKAVTLIKQHKKHIQKIKEYRNGIDIFLRNPGVANTLAKKLSREFHTKMSRSVEQYGWNKTKNRPLHRHTILLRQV